MVDSTTSTGVLLAGRSLLAARKEPPMPDHEILQLAKKIRYDLTALQAKVSELLRMASNLKAPDPDSRTCPECGLLAASLPQGATLADHRYRAHDIDPDEATTIGGT